MLRALCEIAQTEYHHVKGPVTYTGGSIEGHEKVFDVDHIIPFSLWHNNDLWNLVPSHPQINNQKRDKIIGRETLLRSRDRIVYYWQKQNDSHPFRFQNEVGRTLLGKPASANNWELQAFNALSETVEIISLHRGVERWESAVV